MIEFIDSRIDSILKAPDMWGPPLAVELQLILLLELREVAIEGVTQDRAVLRRYQVHLKKATNGSGNMMLCDQLGLGHSASESFTQVLRSWVEVERERQPRTKNSFPAFTPGVSREAKELRGMWDLLVSGDPPDAIAWATFLDRLCAPPVGLSEAHADAVRLRWRQLKSRVGATVTPPQVEGGDDGQVKLAWSRDHFYANLEIYPDNSVEWFFRDRLRNEHFGSTEGDRGPIAERLVTKLREALARVPDSSAQSHAADQLAEARGYGASDHAGDIVRLLLAAGRPKIPDAHGAIEEAGRMIQALLTDLNRRDP
jgi:hypothetical protein